MSSMRKLRRRAARWERYDRHCKALSASFSDWYDIPSTPGYWRAADALAVEWARRRGMPDRRLL
jgi:hypothetical protein